ncbi:MAG: hypothetical protein V4717_00700 [Bacteroidota bacterium]
MIRLANYFKLLFSFLKDRGVLNFFLLGFCILIMYKGYDQMKYYLIILLLASLAVQYIFLLRKSYVFYLLRFGLITALLFEIFFGYLNKKNAVIEPTTITDNWYIKDSVLGWKFNRNQTNIKSILVNGNDTIYNVSYSSDSVGRRIDIEDSNVNVKTKHAIFLGCSYTFGLGLNNDATFPSLFQQKEGEYQSYNYGFSGYGPHQVALLFSQGADVINKRTVHQDSGFALYSYMADHPTRVYGGSSYIPWGGTSPDVYIENDQLLIKQRSKFRNRVINLFNISATLKYFDVQYYYPNTENFAKRFADIINYSANQYWENFPAGNFYVGLYPQIQNEYTWLKYLNKKIKVIEVPLPPDYLKNSAAYLIDPVYDPHPTKKMNDFYIDYITKNMKNN